MSSRGGKNKYDSASLLHLTVHARCTDPMELAACPKLPSSNSDPKLARQNGGVIGRKTWFKRL